MSTQHIAFERSSGWIAGLGRSPRAAIADAVRREGGDASLYAGAPAHPDLVAQVRAFRRGVRADHPDWKRNRRWEAILVA